MQSVETVAAEARSRVPLERPTTRGSSFQRSAARDQSDADLGLPNRRASPAGEAHVAGQHERRYRCRACGRILAMLRLAWTRGASTKSRKAQHLSPFSCLGYVEMAMKKSGFADWNTTTFTDGSAFEVGHQRSPIR